MTFISMRRHYLDYELNASLKEFKGTVLDIGGKKSNRRGSFIPPLEQAEKWIFLNNDPATKPDILASIPPILLEDNSVDVVLMTETIEYIYDFQYLLDEIYRVLKKGGMLIISCPFLHLHHGDYEYDYFRFTESLMRKSLDQFHIAYFSRMGGLLGVVFDLVRGYLNCSLAKEKRIFTKLSLKGWQRLNPIVKVADKHFFKDRFYINTGYFVKAVK